jgi:LPXTG-site transpeptidase (sortase) family protein
VASDATSQAVVDAPEAVATLETGAGSDETRAPSATLAVVGTALCILAALLLSLVAELTVVGSLRQARDQQTSFAELRESLAAATAPVSQADAEGRLLAPGEPVAVLRIPALGLEQVVLEGTTSTVLMKGPGHRRDSVLPGQAGSSVIFGRQAAYGGPFAQAAALPVGSTIQVVTGQGEFSYEITGVRRAGDPQSGPTAAGEGRLTLVTAGGTPYVPSSVVRIDAELQGEPAETPARIFGSAALAQAELPLQGDRSAWVPLVFWAQALLLVSIGFVLLLARWGRWQTWVVGVPVLAVVGLGVANQIARLLPNLL